MKWKTMWNHIRILFKLNNFFDCFFRKQNKIASNDEELSVAVEKYCVMFDKSNKDFHQKDAK